MEFISKIPIQKGWSQDTKYCVTDTKGVKYFLRISPLSKYDIRQHEFHTMQQIAALGVPICPPLEFGVCNEGVYTLLEWIDGTDAHQRITTYSFEEQYTYGLDAGNALQKIHTLPAPTTINDWECRFNQKIDRKITGYRHCSVKYDKGEQLIDYLNANRHLLRNRPQVFQHGDYHIGNFILGNNQKLYIIDFDRSDYGDPWEEFNRIVWSAQVSPAFASGMIDCYFKNKVPPLFWQLLLLYISSNSLSAISWAVPFGQEQVKIMTNQTNDILKWYDDMKRVIPTWYGYPHNLP